MHCQLSIDLRSVIILDDLAGKLQSILSDEESLRQIKELADMIMPPNPGNSGGEPSGGDSAEPGGASDSDEAEGFGGGFNIGAIMSLMSTFNEPDKNSELLIALRPHLSSERQERADKAVRMLKLYNVYINLKDNGMLEGLL